MSNKETIDATQFANAIQNLRDLQIQRQQLEQKYIAESKHLDGLIEQKASLLENTIALVQGDLQKIRGPKKRVRAPRAVKIQPQADKVIRMGQNPVREFMHHHGMSNFDMAQKIGMSRGTIDNILHGRCYPTDRTFDQLEKVMKDPNIRDKYQKYFNATANTQNAAAE